MSHAVANDIHPEPEFESINDPNQLQHPYYLYSHQSLQQGHHQQQQQCHFDQIPPFNNNTHQPPIIPIIPPTPSYIFNLGSPSYAAIPPGPLIPQLGQEQDTGLASATVLPNQLFWDTEPEILSQLNDVLLWAAQDPTTGVLLYQPDMWYPKGPLEALNARQYDDGRYTSSCVFSEPENRILGTIKPISNPKKRGKKASRNAQPELAGETGKTRGRPRLETGGYQDMRERRKEQIRLAQRAYRNRKETAIADLETKVAGLEAGNAEIKNTFQSLLQYVDKQKLGAQIPVLSERLQQFQELLTQRCSEVTIPKTREANSDLKVDDSLQINRAPVKSKTIDKGPPPQEVALPITQQPQQRLGGVIATHEPESQSIIQESALTLDSSLGPFNKKTTALRDEYLDALQHTHFPDWRGDWVDLYEVGNYLAQNSINLPQGESGYVEIPPGDFYHNPLDDQTLSTEDASDFNISRGFSPSSHFVYPSPTVNRPYWPESESKQEGMDQGGQIHQKLWH